MTISTPFSTPYYSGTVATSSDVPGLFPVALNGRAYLVDLLSNQYRRRTIPLIRQQADTQDLPGEHSINPEDLWRRSAEDWSHGAGQTWYDRDSDVARFRSSKGVDPWTRWQMTLLPGTELKRVSANTNLALIPVGSRLYATDGNKIAYTTDVTGAAPTFTDVTALPAANPTSIASDGFNVWTSHTASGIYATTRTTAGTASFVTGTVTLVGYVKGRLMAAAANSVYNVIAAGALPTALFTHPNTDFAWVGFAETRKHILLAGYSGDKSLIYATAIKADGTALDVPTVAGELPDGEIVRSIQGYLGDNVLIGSDKGVRYAQADSSGALRIGALIPTTLGVLCFEGQDRFVWYGLTNYDATSTGLGRIDLKTFTDVAGLAPAYASDLMATAQGAVQSVCTFQGIRVFAVSGSGFWGETTAKVASGTVDSGLITYGLPETKLAVFTYVQHAALAGSVALAISTDGATFVPLGTSSVLSSVLATFGANQEQGSTFELRATLTRSTVDTTTGPTLYRMMLRSEPTPPRAQLITLPIVLHESVTTNGQPRAYDVKDHFDFLRLLTDAQTLVSLQLGEETLSVIARDFEFQPSSLTEDGTFWNGLMVMSLASVVE